MLAEARDKKERMIATARTVFRVRKSRRPTSSRRRYYPSESSTDSEEEEEEEEEGKRPKVSFLPHDKGTHDQTLTELGILFCVVET